MVDNPLFDVADVGPIGGVWGKPTQRITSAKTSINAAKLPQAFGRLDKMGAVKEGDVILDIGGGKFDNAVDWAAERGAKLHVYDPFNRTPEHNQRVIDEVSGGRANKVTINNVLNVIQEPENRLKVLQQAQDALKPGGEAYISVYKTTNRAGETSSGWQEARPLKDYLKEVQQVFPDARMQNGMIIGKKEVGRVGARALSGVKEESKLMARPQMAMRAPDVPKTSKNIPITQSDPIINTAGSYDLLESTTPTGWSVYPVKRGTKIPNFKNEVEAQTAIDAYETQLIAKHGEDEVLQFPIATYTGGFADLELPATKMSTEEISTLRAMYHARDMFSQRDMQNAQNVIKSRISAVDPEAVKNVSPLFDGLLKRKALDEAMGRKPNISESEYRSVVAEAYSRLAEKKWPGAYDLHDIDNAEMLWHNGVAGTNPTPLINKAQDIVNSVFRGELPAAKAISSGKAKGGSVKRYAKGDLVSMYNDYHDTSFKDRARATLNDKHK